jgi:cytochrome c biogenesis protein ResB
MFAHAAHVAELRLPLAANPADVLRECLEQRGFSVRSEADGGLIHVRGDRNRLAPVATLLTHSAVLILTLGLVLSNASGWREELNLAPGETVDVRIRRGWDSRLSAQSGDNSGLRVRNAGFTIVRYADGTVAGYDAEVVLSEGGLEAKHGHVRLNQPLTYRGVAFTLQRYAPYGESYSVTLNAVHDPGYGLVAIAGLLMFLGLTVSFNLPHASIHGRIEPKGLVRLAGHADQRAWDFRRQFAALVAEVDKRGNR